MKKICLLLVVFLMCGCSNNYKTINKKEAQKLIEEKDAILVDVRSTLEFQQGHINNAVSMPITTILEDIVLEYEKDTYIIVYCQSGKRSKTAAEGLIEIGYENVYDLGSINNWS